MLPRRTMGYLLYSGFLTLLLKFTYAGTVPFNEDTTSENSIKPPPFSHLTSTDSTSGSTSTSTSTNNTKRDAMKRAFAECRTQWSWFCLKIEFVKIIERLTDKDELSIAPGISVVRNVNASEVKSNELMADVARSYPNDPNSRLNGYIINKLSSFLQTHFLRFKLIDNEALAEARSAVETGRKGKFGKKGGMEMLLAAGLAMKSTLMALGMGAVALMAGKALMTALMALTLSSVLGLKSLASGGGGKTTTYEIVSKPIYTSSHSHSYDEGHGHMGGGGGHSGSGYSGYSRQLNLDSPNDLK